MTFVLALRRLGEPVIGEFLHDPDPLIRLEAARAINDAPIREALPALAALISADGRLSGGDSTPDPTATSHRNSSGIAEAMSATDYQELILQPLARRVINANFRLGKPENAGALAAFAAQSRSPLSQPAATPSSASGNPPPGLSEGVPDDVRAEALLMLGQWAAPSPRDKVLGLYRPLAQRDPFPAADALLRHFDSLLADPSTTIKVASINAAADLALRSLSSQLASVVADTLAEGRVRAAALKALAKAKAPEFAAALETARLDLDSAVKRAAIFLSSASGSEAAAPQLAEVLKDGTREEKQVALAALSQIPGTVADEIIYGVLRPWVEGEPMDPALELDVLEASRARSDERIKSYLLRYETNLPPGVKTAAYHWALAGGNPENGKKVFIEHPAAACYRCHAVDGAGGEVGPHMDHVALRVTPEQLLESIVDPNAKIAEGFENLLIEMKDGGFHSGIIKQETDDKVVLATPEDGLVTLQKKNIKSRARGASGMPEGIPEILTPQELRDVLAFLIGLK